MIHLHVASPESRVQRGARVESARGRCRTLRVVRLGVLILPDHRWPAAAERWSRAEGLGFDHAWTYDHIAWRDLRDSTWFAAVPTLAAAAMLTSRIRLGTLVASPNFRHPVPFALELLTLDDIAGGRLTAGIGAGGQGWDATVLGQEPWSMPERLDRFAEFVDLLDRLLTDRAVSFQGRFWTAREARTHPGCVQQPRVPFAIAATGPRSMRVAARYASIWVTNGDRAYEGVPLPPDEGAEVVARQLRLFEQACEAEGRNPATVDKLVLTGPRLDTGLQSVATFRTVVDAYGAVGVTDLVVPWPRHEPPYAGDESILDQIAALG
jgi:alkanesulfonate monooxygenase SsuD/methylene tetrahydromethanopterin reductase-like flavin-dependent oxidoreductase (luciferase family)